MIMDELLCVLLCHFGFLYKDRKFKITDSLHSEAAFGNGAIRLSNDAVEIQLILDRGEFDLMLRPANSNDEWFPLNVVADVLEDGVKSPAYCNDAATLKRIYPRLKRKFSSKEWPSTLKRLKRWKQMFATN